ncbi:MAG: hypothetical protein ACK2UW_12935 [Anaerolineales bacterium]
MRRLARQLDISMNAEDPQNLPLLLRALELENSDADRLSEALQAGISHQVLNARKHTEESQIIAGAGAFGAITIATNMAGRGVDIRLGGELAEEVLIAVNRVLKKNGVENPYSMSLEARYDAIKQIPEVEYGVYATEIHYFLKYIDEMEKVRELGGLHVIGSERHDARRIDNQLRGRSARQGDPGSSRFYLSMEDQLMRLFGGEQADALLRRLRVDDSMPLEVGLVGRLIEQAQTRVEGANFDTRKHLLEYDDVLNAQRAKIYAQRDRVFQKDDLSEDVTDMLRTEISTRVPEALDDPEGPWRLLGWLEQIQPTIVLGGRLIPSFTLQLLLDSLGEGPFAPDQLRATLINIAEKSIVAEHNHLMRSAQQLLSQSELNLENQLSERLEAVDNYFDAVSSGEIDEDESTRSARQIMDEVTGLVHVPIRLSRDQEHSAARDPEQLQELIEQEVENTLAVQTARRVVGAISRRFDGDLDLNPAELPVDDWQAFSDQVLDTFQVALDARYEKLVGTNGSNGVIIKDIDRVLDKMQAPLNTGHALSLLMQIPQGTRTTFDRKTHRRVKERLTRLSYVYYAAHLLDNLESDEIADAVLEHLEKTQDSIQTAWGIAEFTRLASYTTENLTEKTRRGLQNALGEAEFAQIQGTPLQNLPAETRSAIVTELGRQALTEIYRELLLRVISELWIEYLTQMEALRVSIGLEAYGQRDPLVQYKGRASQLFQELISNIRLGVVTRMFTFRPRDLSAAQAGVSQGEVIEAEFIETDEPDDESAETEDSVESPDSADEPEAAAAGGSNKRSRRRRRRK